jgi:hypothetical protein
MDWHDVTPPSWPLAERHPYVFGRALATLAATTPNGIRLTGNVLSALVESEEAPKLKAVVERAIWQSRRHQRTIERVGKLLVELTLGMGEPP